jgi:hypothetical protein
MQPQPVGPMRPHVVALVTSSGLVQKIRRLAGNSKLGDDGALHRWATIPPRPRWTVGRASDDGHQLTWKKETEQC